MSELQKYSGTKTKSETLYLQKNIDIEALIKKATLGIITENSLVNFREGKNITEKRKQLKRRKLNAKEKIILDCIGDKFMKKEDCYYLRKSDEWKNEKFPLDEFPFLLQDSVFSSKSGKLEEGMKSIGIGVILNTREIQKKTGLRTPCWKISEWVWGLFDKAYFIKEERILYRDGKFEKYKSPCLDKYLHIQSKTTGHISRRKNIEEEHTELVEFLFIFRSEWSRLFLRSLLLGQFTIFPHKVFYKLKDEHQELIRYLSIWGGMSWHKLRTHSIVEIRNLLGLKSKNVKNLKKSIKRIIDELEKKGFISKWEAYGRGWDSEYRIKVKFKKKLFAPNLLEKLKK